jgi:SNF2 family DNA or RNA helicase
MIKIGKHIRGIVVSAEGGIDQNEKTRHLQWQLRSYEAFVVGGRLITQLEALGEIFELFGDDVQWDQDLLQIAKTRRDHRHGQIRARLEVAAALENPRAILTGYEMLSRLDEHQAQAVAAIVVPSLKGIAIFDEQGTGKTLMALSAFDFLHERRQVRKLLVIAPKSVLVAWETQAREFLGDKYRVGVITGDAPARRRVILGNYDIILVGYETVRLEEKLLSVTVNANPLSHMLVVDESYFVKNPGAARSLAVTRLRSVCERAVVLCGSPAPNAAVDVVNQIDLADGGVTFGGLTISRHSQEAYNEIAGALQNAIYLRRLKADLFPNIPPKQIEKIYLSLAQTQRKMYDSARDKLITEVRSLDDRQFTQRLNSFLTKRVRLLQICSNPRMLDPSYDEVSAKLSVLDQLIRELVVEQSKKVVIWSYFRVSLDEIARRYSAYGVVRIDGSVPKIEDRLLAIEKFQKDPETRIFVGNAAAAGAGITLTAAHHAIYESFSNQAAHYMQSADRIHRRGQTEQVVSHILIARDTIEDYELQRLLRKEQAGRQLLGDKSTEPVTRERFLAELEGIK